MAKRGQKAKELILERTLRTLPFLLRTARTCRDKDLTRVPTSCAVGHVDADVSLLVAAAMLARTSLYYAALTMSLVCRTYYATLTMPHATKKGVEEK